jgi:hypothetical protein
VGRSRSYCDGHACRVSCCEVRLVVVIAATATLSLFSARLAPWGSEKRGKLSVFRSNSLATYSSWFLTSRCQPRSGLSTATYSFDSVPRPPRAWRATRTRRISLRALPLSLPNFKAHGPTQLPASSNDEAEIISTSLLSTVGQATLPENPGSCSLAGAIADCRP